VDYWIEWEKRKRKEGRKRMRRMQTLFWIRWKNCEGEGCWCWIYEKEASREMVVEIPKWNLFVSQSTHGSVAMCSVVCVLEMDFLSLIFKCFSCVFSFLLIKWEKEREYEYNESMRERELSKVVHFFVVEISFRFLNR
jgi:hypothetical protein